MTDESIQCTPSGRTALFRARRPLKRWRYVAVLSPELMLCVADVRIGPLRQRFFAVCEPGMPLLAATVRRGLELTAGRVAVATADLRIDIEIDEQPGVESVHRSGGRTLVWTRKQAGVRARGNVELRGRSHELDCGAVVDDTLGYHERRTRWQWSAGVGLAASGEALAWNLVAGVNDEPAGSERAVWLDGAPREVEPVRFAPDLSRIDFARGGPLRFEEWAARSAETNLVVVRSAYRQPFGSFAGELAGIELASGLGVMEWHEARW